MEKGKENKLAGFNTMFQKAWEKQFLKIYVEEIPKMLESYKVLIRDIAEVKQSTREDIAEIKKNHHDDIINIKKDYHEEIIELKKAHNNEFLELKTIINKLELQIDKLKEKGCAPIRQHVKMHNYLYGIFSIIATISGFVVMWLFGR